MPYEEIQGEIMTMANNVDLGLSGTSTDYEGAQSQTFHVRWSYPGGISGTSWSGLNDSAEITSIANGSDTNEGKINSINGIIYAHVRTLLTEGGWDAFYASHASCITISM